MSRRHNKRWTEMTADELAAATAEYDRAMPGLPGRPLTPSQRKAFRATGKRGRPRVGEGANRVMLSIERGLLKQADALAKRRKVNRSQLVADALRSELARAKSA